MAADTDALCAILWRNLVVEAVGCDEFRDGEAAYVSQSCDASRGGDMRTIESTYLATGGMFLVVEHEGVVVGMAGVQRHACGQYELRRMQVLEGVYVSLWVVRVCVCVCVCAHLCVFCLLTECLSRSLSWQWVRK